MTFGILPKNPMRASHMCSLALQVCHTTLSSIFGWNWKLVVSSRRGLQGRDFIMWYSYGKGTPKQHIHHGISTSMMLCSMPTSLQDIVALMHCVPIGKHIINTAHWTLTRADLLCRLPQQPLILEPYRALMSLTHRLGILPSPCRLATPQRVARRCCKNLALSSHQPQHIPFWRPSPAPNPLSSIGEQAGNAGQMWPMEIEQNKERISLLLSLTKTCQLVMPIGNLSSCDDSSDAGDTQHSQCTISTIKATQLL